MPAPADSFSPRDLCEDAAAAARSRADARALRFEADIPAYLPERTEGDAAALRAALDACLEDALSGAPGPVVRFQVGMEAADSGAWIFHCEIEGAGPRAAAPAERARALGGDAGTDPRPGNTARVWFTARLARAAAPGPARPPDGAEPISFVAEGPVPDDRRILVCEDNAMNQKVIRIMLEHLGYASDVASNGQEALAALARGRYEMVFMDCQMPVLDGYEATRRIRATPGMKGNVVIAMTAHAMIGDREKCLESGMDDYISKPISFRDLEALLRKWTQGIGG